MKTLIAILTLTLGSVFAVSAQTPQTNNEGYVGYTYLRQNVGFDRGIIRFDVNTDSHGVEGAYTRYFAGKGKNDVNTVGFTADVAANFKNGESTLATVMVGLTAKARNNERFQPYARVLGGVARQHINRLNLITGVDSSNTSAAFDVGAGLDINLKANSRYKWRLVGVDYINTGFGGERQNSWRFSTGLTF